MLALVLTAMPATDSPFTDVNATHAAFRVMAQSFRRYEQALSGVAPEYDRHTDAGRLFDMYYHLEILHRGTFAAQDWLHQAKTVLWRDLGFDS